MIQRIRDKARSYRPQQKISYKDWVIVSGMAQQAEVFKTNKFYQSMKDNLKDAESAVLENRIKEVREITKISDTFSKIFTTDREIQVNETVGRVKFIRFMLNEIEVAIKRKADLERKEADGLITIQREEKEEVLDVRK